MSDLRTRIAAVIRREVPCHPPAADRIADAVIRELGLHRCTGQGPYANQVWYQTDWIIE